MVGFKTFTIRSNHAVVRSEPEKAISSLSDRGNAARRTFSNRPTPVIQLARLCPLTPNGVARSNAVARHKLGGSAKPDRLRLVWRRLNSFLSSSNHVKAE